MSSTQPSSSQPRLLYIPRQNRRNHNDSSASLAPPHDRRRNEEDVARVPTSSPALPSVETVATSTSSNRTSSIGGTRKRGRIQASNNERFHGAFTGGFSAGYYNTVGSKEGWQPSEYGTSTEGRKKGGLGRGSEIPQQSIESFMDEQDHDEWGGPRGVRSEFLSHHHDTGGVSGVGAKKGASTTDLFAIHVRSGIGDQLLRALGWRGASASSAYVPVHQGVPMNDVDDDNHHGSSVEPLSTQSFLSSKRLRKIEMNRVNVHIPKPKIDLCGLGYEPFRDAPEFARRSQVAARRTRPIRFGAHDSQLAPRAYEGDDDGDDRVQNVPEDRFRDFVGSRSVGGFALLDDEDDAYDDNSIGASGLRVNSQEFDLELDSNEGSDHDNAVDNSHVKAMMRGENRQSTLKERTVEGIFSSWAASSAAAAADASTSATIEASVTSDGRPLLPGFMLVATSTSSTKRYRGPDVPVHYELQRHSFGQREHPLIYQALLHAERLQSEEAKSQNMVQEALHLNRVTPTIHTSTVSAESRQTVPRDAAIKTSTFAGVAKAMASRFTPASSSQVSSVPQSNDTGTAKAAHVATTSSSGGVSRTVSTFVPSALLCKRLGVPAPMNRLATPAASSTRTKEEGFFQDEILSRLNTQRENVDTSTSRDHDSSASPENIQQNHVPLEPPQNDRPSVAFYKSIFEPHADELDKVAAEISRSNPDQMDRKSTYDAHRPSHFHVDKPFVAATQNRNAAEEYPVRLERSRDTLDEDEVRLQRQRSTDTSRDNASESTGSSGSSPRRRKRRKDRKRTSKKARKKRKDAKRMRDH